ncbi:hypothetical protein CRI70_29655 [Streptomyces sp. Ru87]|nr:hypothetical protein CRI70_29655 [Streptomyces sp. Ru87]
MVLQLRVQLKDAAEEGAAANSTVARPIVTTVTVLAGMRTSVPLEWMCCRLTADAARVLNLTFEVPL